MSVHHKNKGIKSAPHILQNLAITTLRHETIINILDYGTDNYHEQKHKRQHKQQEVTIWTGIN
jgi:translation initiation factor IF-3